MDEVELVPSTRYPSVLQTNQFIAENFFRFVGEPKWEARVGKGVAGERRSCSSTSRACAGSRSSTSTRSYRCS